MFFKPNTIIELPLCSTSGVDNDNCESNPCQAGSQCSVVGDGYVCYCEQGYTGTDCETGEYVINMKKSHTILNYILLYMLKSISTKILRLF